MLQFIAVILLNFRLQQDLKTSHVTVYPEENERNIVAKIDLKTSHVTVYPSYLRPFFFHI